MNLLQLRYFKLLAENEHMHKTADELHISAPSLSATIARLERELGVQLFDRNKNRLKLNRYGNILLKHVLDAFAYLENARQEIEDMNHQQHNRLAIAITSPTIYHKTFEAFLKEFPDINTSYTVVKINDWLVADSLMFYDFILTSPIDIVGNDWEYELLCEDDRAVLAVYKGHPLAAMEETRFIETKNEKFIALSLGHSMRRYFDLLCNAAGFVPNIIIECDYQMRSKLVSEHYGITLTTESGVRSKSQTWNADDISFVRIIDPGVKRPQGILWNKRRYISKAASLFREFIISYYKNHPFGD